MAVSIDTDFIPVNDTVWYNCSTIFGCELDESQQDWVISMNASGYFAIGYNFSTIFATPVYAKDGMPHTISYAYNGGPRYVAIDGVTVATFSDSCSGSTVSVWGLGWNTNSDTTKIKGRLYKVRFYNRTLTASDIATNYNFDKGVLAAGMW